MPKLPTTKALLILRHAHAEANSADGSDFSRRLSEDGRKEAKRVGKFLRHQELGIDAILCSAAVRTIETTEGVLEGAKLKLPVVTDRAIYEATDEDILKVVRATQGSVKRLLLVGHNPGVADLLAALTSRQSTLSVHYPPATLSLVEFDGEWQALGPGRAMLRWVVPVKLMDV